MSSIGGVNPSHISITEYNKNARPFYPNSYKSPYLVRFSNLPPNANESSLRSFIKSQISHLDDGGISGHSFDIVALQKEDDGKSEANFAILEISQWEFGVRLVETINGYKWEQKQLEVTFVSKGTDDQGGYRPWSSNAAYSEGYYSGLPYVPPTAMNNYMYSPQTTNQQTHMLPPHYSRNTMPYLARRPSNRGTLPRKDPKISSSKPLPPFIMNLVNDKSGEPDDGKSDLTSESSLPVTNEFITVQSDEGQSIKVNPCRLFIGNIPFSSTWTTLKNFLVSKSEEAEPGNNIKILRVEIPMQLLASQSVPGLSNPVSNPNLNVSLNKLNNYQFLSSFTSGMDKPQVSDGQLSQLSRGLSRGFAIVTTGNKESLDKLIQYFDNVDFEGRSLTVRFDKFPDFNNYILQQLNPENNHNMFKPLEISNLAFERNLFQQNLYYGNSGYSSVPGNYLQYPYYYNNPHVYPNYGPSFQHVPLSYIQYPHLQTHHPTVIYPQYSPLNEYNTKTTTYPPRDNAIHKIPRTHTPVSPNTSNASANRQDPKSHISEDQKARDLVNSFRSLGLSSS